jgi:hypothetical protein
LHQEGGVETLQDSYGVLPDDFRGKLKFLPTDPKKYPWAKLFKKLKIVA